MPKLERHGLQIWTDFEAATPAGTHLHTIVDAAAAGLTQDLNSEDHLDLTIPRNAAAWDHLVKRTVIRVETDDGVVREYRVANLDERHTSREFRGTVQCEGVLFELRGPSLCERVETGGLVRHQFELLSLTPTEHLDEVILPAGPTWITRGTVDATADFDLVYDYHTALRAVRELAIPELADQDISFTRQGDATYKINLLDKRGGSATVARVSIGKNATGVERKTDDRETRTKIYAVGVDSDFGQARLADARWPVKARDLGADWVELEVTHRGAAINPASLWDADDELNDLRLGNPDRTELQIITASQFATGRIFIADASLYAVGDELVFFRNASGDDLTFLEHQSKISGATDRRPLVMLEEDVPPSRNLATNPAFDNFTGSDPDNTAELGTPTVTENTNSDFSQIAKHSAKVVADAIDEGLESDAITITPTDLNPYFSAFARIWVESGSVRFELEHSTLGIIPEEDSDEQAVTDQIEQWIDLSIELGSKILLPSGTVKLRILSEGGAATFYIDAWQLTQTSVNFPFYDIQPGVELWRRAINNFVGQGVSSEEIAYGLTMLDLSDNVFIFDALTLGADIQIDDADLGISTLERLIEERRDLLKDAQVGVTLAKRRGALTDFDIKRGRRRPFVGRPQREVALLHTPLLSFDLNNGSLFIDYVGNEQVGSIAFDTSSTAQPTRANALAGSTNNGRSARFDTTADFMPEETAFITVVPTSGLAGAGKRGPTYELSIEAPERIIVISHEILGGATYTILITDTGIAFLLLAVGSGFADLPAVATSNSGRIIRFLYRGGSFTGRIRPNGSDTVDGASFVDMGTSPEEILLQSNGGTNWVRLKT